MAGGAAVFEPTVGAVVTVDVADAVGSGLTVVIDDVAPPTGFLGVLGTPQAASTSSSTPSNTGAADLGTCLVITSARPFHPVTAGAIGRSGVQYSGVYW